MVGQFANFMLSSCYLRSFRMPILVGGSIAPTFARLEDTGNVVHLLWQLLGKGITQGVVIPISSR